MRFVEIIAAEGDGLPVSAFPVDGKYPVDTSPMGEA